MRPIYSVQICGRIVKFEVSWDYEYKAYVILMPHDNEVSRRINEIITGKVAKNVGVRINHGKIYLHDWPEESPFEVCERFLAFIEDNEVKEVSDV